MFLQCNPLLQVSHLLQRSDEEVLFSNETKNLSRIYSKYNLFVLTKQPAN